MKSDHLANVELKSLRILNNLLQNPNITVVAETMAMQPSGVSYHLNKLRESLQDPLLVQVGREMQLTQKALTLAPKLSALLSEVDNVLFFDEFDPHSLNRHFRIAMQDIGAEALIPILVTKLREIAPNVVIDVVNWPKNVEQQMLEGKVDIAVNAIVKLSSQLYGYQLNNMPLSLVTSRNHVLAKSNHAISDIFDYPHVRVFPTALGEGLVDDLAIRLGKVRTVVATASTFSVLSSIIESSDIVGVFATGAAQRLGKDAFYSTVIKEIPPIPLHCFWHQRVHHDPAHQFIRNLIIEISQQIIEDLKLAKSKIDPLANK
ncbi:LysR family transcriptional regulator [Vibrio inusitatus NBRC 102082]|uniref:LysR family transcriptional regulator n=1 Tax=Vibrio inusitatus NBRC 102082 TaxID=1219070 RepID=A0A4Y3HRS8_9VIBR|nr:LysR family transcriptional regulator [Vibrio inusitatus]GEA49490.1 LysR family transcriptional regulator [Vibrio inusitatus NBRC 102082]